jgi:carboxymethylenebutenolidase
MLPISRLLTPSRTSDLLTEGISMKLQLLAAALAVTLSCSVTRSPAPPSGAADDHSTHMQAAGVSASPAISAETQSQGIAGVPPSANSARARLAASPRHGEWVKIPFGEGRSDSLMAWVVYPSNRNRAPVVVVVHEIFGLQTWVRGVADQVAADGFIAIAPDFLSRLRGGPSTVELTADSARKLIGGVDAAERNRVIVAAANYAMMQPAAEPRYAVIGYCWGGATVFQHAVHGGVHGFSGGVAFYGLAYLSGGRPATESTPAQRARVNPDSMARINAPMMLLNGSQDARIASAMPQLDSLMKVLGKDYSGINYEGATHGFLREQDDPKDPRNEAEERANVAAARDGWQKTIAFLRKNLGAR